MTGNYRPGGGLMVPPSGKNGRAMKVLAEPSERSVTPPLWLLTRLLLTDKRGAAEVRREIEHATERKVREQEREDRERMRLSDEDREAMRAVHTLTRQVSSVRALIGLADTVAPWELGQALAMVQAERRRPGRYERRELEGKAQQAEEYAVRLREAAKLASSE